MTIRLAVLVSGRGSNLQALLDAIAAGTLDARVTGVFSDRAQAPALSKVAPALRWSAAPRDFPDRAAFDQALGDAVAAARPDWIVCAGYMRILGQGFVQRFAGRLLNVHPSLLPKYRGLHTHAQALAAGDAEHGASVHYVTAELDGGPVIAQAALPILANDTPESLAGRLLPFEHRLLVATVRLIATGEIALEGNRVVRNGVPLRAPLRLNDGGDLG